MFNYDDLLLHNSEEIDVLSVFPMFWYHQRTDIKSTPCCKYAVDKSNTDGILWDYIYSNYLNNSDENVLKCLIDQLKQMVLNCKEVELESFSMAYLGFYSTYGKKDILNHDLYYCNVLKYTKDHPEIKEYGFPDKTQIVNKPYIHQYFNVTEGSTTYSILFDPILVEFDNNEKVLSMTRDKIKSLLKCTNIICNYNVFNGNDLFIMHFTKKDEVKSND